MNCKRAAYVFLSKEARRSTERYLYIRRTFRKAPMIYSLCINPQIPVRYQSLRRLTTAHNEVERKKTYSPKYHHHLMYTFH